MSKSVNSLKFKKLLCENLKNPSGIDKENPRFSWILTSQKRGIYQTGYKILVASSKKNINHNRGDMWDSGKINSNKSIYIKYRGKKLKSDNRYWWKVKCKDDQNNWNSSKPQWFEMGLLEKDDWNGKWIGTKKEISAPLFKKDFNLLDKVDRARLYICGLGYQEIYLNKKKVGDQVLVPNWTDYGPRKMNNLNYPIKDKMSHRVQYLSYNVDNYLKEGNNELKVLLGNGWFNQRERTAEGELWYGTPRLILQMNILLKDDSKIEIKSDKNWKVTKSPITYNNIYYGETYDARLEKDKENSDSDNKEEVKIMKPPGGKLVSQLSPSDKKIKVINPKIRLNPEKNIYIFDLGQNISGWVRLKVNGPAGTRIRLRFAEELTKNNNLDFQSTGGKEQIQEDNYILKGKGMETYEPSFSWHGFRYVEVKGYPGIPDLDDIKGILVHSDIEVTGDFSCSSKRINKIFELYKWSQLTNLHGGVPSDCPHRERLGYTGDGQLTAEAAIYCFDMHNFYEKWINDIADSQGKDTGHVQHTAPFYGGGGGPGAWGCAYILMPWYLYKYYGDKEILEKHYQGMLKWMNYLESRTDTGYIVVREEEGGWCLGDWCTPGETEIPESLVNTFYFAFSAGVIARIADILDKNEDKKQYLELKQMIENKFNKRFFNREKTQYWEGRQGSNAYPLLLNCIPERYKKQVLTNMLKNIKQNNYHLDTGITGTPVLFQVLAENNLIDIACNILSKDTYPGYGYMLQNNATTLWETWEGDASHNHPMFGSIISWFFRYLAGIRPKDQNPGFKKTIIKPVIPENMNYAGGKTGTNYGQISSRWEKKDNNIEFEIKIPVNSTAEIYLPPGSKILENDKIIWTKKQNCTINKKWLYNIKQEKNNIIFSIGSGFYRFTVISPELPLSKS